MPWRGFEALVPYYGGKRKLAPRIFRELARVHPSETWSSLRLVDPFLGAGSVSLYAKAHGFGVVCGDLAERSVIAGKAPIENDGVHISDDDIMRLFVPVPDHSHLIAESYVPDCFTEETARFLDNALAAASQVTDETRRYLLQLLLVKYIYWLRPHSQFSSPGAFNRPFAERPYDDIKSTYKHAIMANGSHPLPALRSLAADINRAVARGGQPCRAMKGGGAGDDPRRCRRRRPLPGSALRWHARLRRGVPGTGSPPGRSVGGQRLLRARWPGLPGGVVGGEPVVPAVGDLLWQRGGGSGDVDQRGGAVPSRARRRAPLFAHERGRQ